MKNLLLFAAVAASFAVASTTWAQTSTATTTATKGRHTARITSTTSGSSRLSQQLARYQRAAIAPPTPRVDGSVPRAIRSGNPLQMINPFAPAAYGDGHDVTRHEAEDPNQRPEGLKLVAVEF